MEHRHFIGQNVFFFARARMRVYSSVAILACAFSALLTTTLRAANSISIDAQTQQQLSNIQNSQTQICLPAIDALGHSKNPAVIKPLADAFDTESRPLVRRYIVDALGNLRNRASISTLKKALNDSDTQVRQSAVAAVALLSPTDEQNLLIEHAQTEKDPTVKRSMIHHLGLMKSNESKNALKTFSQDKDAKVRDMAKQKLDPTPQENR